MTKEEYLYVVNEYLVISEANAKLETDYYRRYISSMGEEHEQEIMDELGSPYALAGKINNKYAATMPSKPKSRIGKKMAVVGVSTLLCVSAIGFFGANPDAARRVSDRMENVGNRIEREIENRFGNEKYGNGYNDNMSYESVYKEFDELIEDIDIKASNCTVYISKTTLDYPTAFITGYCYDESDFICELHNGTLRIVTPEYGKEFYEEGKNEEQMVVVYLPSRECDSVNIKAEYSYVELTDVAMDSLMIDVDDSSVVFSNVDVEDCDVKLKGEVITINDSRIGELNIDGEDTIVEMYQVEIQDEGNIKTTQCNIALSLVENKRGYNISGKTSDGNVTINHETKENKLTSGNGKISINLKTTNEDIYVFTSK